MTKASKNHLTPENSAKLLQILKLRFEENFDRHSGLEWTKVESKLQANPDKLWSLSEMERTGGEPDVAGFDKAKEEFVFYDFSEETPAGRRNLCYDQEAWNSRKANKPASSAKAMAAEMGVELTNELEYHHLQSLGHFDNKTSSWIETPESVRKLGGALFADYRFGKVFIYHNGAESYYAVRGFRGVLRV